MERTRKLAAIMFTDIEGYTAVMQRSEDEALNIRNQHRELFEKNTKNHHGQILQYYGDGTLSIFDSAVDAVRCAYLLQKAFLEEPRIPVRIGIHTGDILIYDNDVIGDGVNIASRIQSLGVAGSILFSEKVCDEVKNQKGITVKYLGSYDFKNVSKKINVYALANEGVIVPNSISKKEKLSSPQVRDLKARPQFFSRWGQIASILILILLIGVVSIWFWNQQRKEATKLKLDETLIQIENLAEDLSIAGAKSGEGINAWHAFILAKEVQKNFPKETRLDDLWPLFSRRVNIYSQPSGAKVYVNAYEAPDSSEVYIGQTPLDSISFPTGYLKLKLVESGSEIVEDVIWNTYLRDSTFSYRLPPSGSLPEGMVLVNFSLNDQNKTGEHDFYMDRFEVTNRAYQVFVDNDGYKREEFWEQPFIKAGHTISWEEAMDSFIDQTGQASPGNWIGGTFPVGQANHPASSISWYEAMAYAKFARKSLPTREHWSYVSANQLSSVIIPKSNYQGNGTMPVGTLRSMNRFGVQDMAGNVREWIFNAGWNTGTRLISGGGFGEAVYFVGSINMFDAWDRSPSNGFRCVRYQEYSPFIRQLEEWTLQEHEQRHLGKEPISADVFEVYLTQFDYKQSDLEAVIDSRTEEKHWIKEKIYFNAAYGGERMIAYLFLPKRGQPPFQTVVYFPAGSARRELALQTWQIDFLLKNGRAVMYPVYQDLHERISQKHSGKDSRIMQIKDLKRSIDYLQTRMDIDTNNLAYMGISFGGAIGPIAMAAEDRLKACILIIAGLYPPGRFPPEVDAQYYLPYVDRPVLMLNGENDNFFPFETSQKPFFELLGTQEKKFIPYKGGHHVPKVSLIRESLAWLDRYLEPIDHLKN